MSTENPFDVIEKRLSEIETLLQEIKNPITLKQEPQDRINLTDACEITGLSKASIYKMTHEKRLPHMKFGSRLVFSRRQLTIWVESHTLPSSSPEDELNANLVKSAKKHLRNAK